MMVLYHTLMLMGLVLVFPLMLPILLMVEKRRKTIWHRLGLAPLPKSLTPSDQKRNVWIHALSVGEVISAIPLVKRFRTEFPNHRVVFSASTYTGIQIARQRLSGYTEAIFHFPYDLLFSVNRIVNKVDPILVIIVETDIWPCFLTQMKVRNIPVILANARISDRSFAGYRKLARFIRPLLGVFSHICAQTQRDGQRLAQLGGNPHQITVTGNIKFDQEIKPDTDGQLAHFKCLVGLDQDHQRHVVVAGSTHPGEEAILLEAFSRLKSTNPDLLLVIVPRDPNRGKLVEEMAEKTGFNCGRITQLNAPKPMDVVVVDTIGMLQHLYALADVAFVGGSLVNFGGHNPLEPAALAKPVIFGPYMKDFLEISRLLLASGGAVEIKDTQSLYERVNQLLSDPVKAAEMGNQARDVFARNRGAIGKTISIIRPFI